MVINVDKIIVKDRIRKDFGNIAELAADIKENGLISPIVVNKDYVLLAGERRLRAVKHLSTSKVLWMSSKNTFFLSHSQMRLTRRMRLMRCLGKPHKKGDK